MTSLSFDPMAHIYDETRGFPADVVHRVAEVIDQAAGGRAETRYLEVGIGTGRIALPLATLGRHVSGVDISEQMLARLQEKLYAAGWQELGEPWGILADEDPGVQPPVQRFLRRDPVASMRFLLGDITHLPFRDQSFDAVVAVHIFHLVSQWKLALQEALRVLRPGGQVLHCWDEYEPSELQEISDAWIRIVKALGGDSRRPGSDQLGEITTFLHEQGLEVKRQVAFTWLAHFTPRSIADRYTKRYLSVTWTISDSIFSAAVEHMEQWLRERYGDTIGRPRPQTRRFVVSRAQLPR